MEKLSLLFDIRKSLICLIDVTSEQCDERRKSGELRSHMRIDKYIPLTKINCTCILYSIISLCKPRSKGK